MLNTEQALTCVLQLVHGLDEDGAAIYTAVSKNPYEWKSAVGPIPQLYFLEQDLRRTLVEEAASRICDAAVRMNSQRPNEQGFGSIPTTTAVPAQRRLLRKCEPL